MDTLLLRRQDVASLLTLEECIRAVENAFKLYAEGKCLPPKILGIHTPKGGFHIKAGVLDLEKSFFVAKTNSNFPLNRKEYGLPLIQGVVIVCDGENGQLLALMDSIEITIIRTGAATAVAAKWLAPINSKAVTICGCGNQGRISLRALLKVRPVEKVYAFDIDETQSQQFAKDLSGELQIEIVAVRDLKTALRQSSICITCTPSKQPFLRQEDIMPGTFIAAVGADSEEKQELYPELLAANKVVADLAEQCSNIGELHHALLQKQMVIADVYAELGDIIAGKKAGRTSDEEIIIFDSTGMALQDVAAASIVYQKALAMGIGMKLDFAEQKNSDTNSEVLEKNQKAIAVLSSFFPFR